MARKAEIDRFQLQKEICRLSNTKLDCGKSLAELTEYKGVSLWWYTYITFMNRVFKILNGELTEKTHRYKTIKRVGKLIYYPTLYYVWNFIEKIYYPNQENSKNRKIIIIESPRYWMNSKEIFFGSIKEKLLADGKTEILSTFSVGYDTHRIETMLDMMKNEENIKHRPIEYYQSIGTNLCEYKTHMKYSKIWDEIKNDKTLHDLLTFHDIDMYNILISELENCFKTKFGEIVSDIETIHRMVQKESPSVIVVIDEVGRPYSYIMGCKLGGKPSIAVQHGTISSQLTFWCGSERFQMIPDITTVYGKTYQDVLVKTKMYRETDIVITGNHRDDNILQERSKEQICKAIGLNTKKKIIVWALTMISNQPDENRRYISAMLDVVKKADVQLVISLHPTDSKQSEQYLWKLDLPGIIIADKTDINNLIYICDTFITKKSTTAITAMVMGKPVIVMNFSGQPDMQPYVSEGLATGVYNEEGLIPAIELALNGRKKEQKEALYNLCYIQDGKATDRVVDAIKSLIKTGE